MVNQVAQLGEPLYRKLEPTGYSNSSAQWANSAGLMARMNFALNLANSKVPGVKVESATKTDDPLVFFGSLAYTKNFAAHHTVPISDPSNPAITSEVAYIRPGDAFGFQLGSVLSLNPETSMTIGWNQQFTREAKLDGQPLPASYLVEGSLRVGTSYMFAPGRLLDITMGVGLTPDTPNLQFSVSFPFRRQMWKPSY